MINHDRMIYLVLCRYGDGMAWAERDIGRTNKRDTILDMLSGALPNVVQVIELNYVEFTSRDVTGEFVVEAVLPEIRSKVFAQLYEQDHARDYRKNEVSDA